MYRTLYREGRPLGIGEVQQKAELNSSSLAFYHLNKLVEAGLAEEKEGGYFVNRVLFENMIRLRRSVIPLQATFAAFFATMVFGLVLFLGPRAGGSIALFIFALVTNCLALGIFAFQTINTLREYRT